MIKHLFAIVLFLLIINVFSQDYKTINKQRLDSIVLYHQHSCVNFTVPHWAMKFVYDSSHANTHVVTAIYDELNDAWLNCDSTIYTHINGNVVESLSYLWFLDSTNIIMPNFYKRSEFFYNNANLLEKEIKYCSFNNLLPDSCRTELYTYDSFSNIVLRQINEWSGYHWYDYVKIENTFDTLGQYKIKERAYSSNNGAWDMYYYIDYFFDQAANTQTGYVYNKEFPYFQWELAQSFVNHYDIHSNVISILRLDKNYDTGQMFPSMKNEFLYDNNYEKKDLILPAFDIQLHFMSQFPEFHHKITETQILFPDSSHWYLHGRAVFYYSTHTDSILVIHDNYSIQVYPNPANEFINFVTNDFDNYSAVDIYNAIGQLIKTSSFRGNIQVPVRDLSKGMYFYKINTGKRTATGRFIVH